MSTAAWPLPTAHRAAPQVLESESRVVTNRLQGLLASAARASNITLDLPGLAALAANSSGGGASGPDSLLAALQQALDILDLNRAARKALMLEPPAASAPTSAACGPCCFYNAPDNRCVCLGVEPCPLAWSLSRPALQALVGEGTAVVAGKVGPGV